MISNTDLWERTNQTPASHDIKKRKWGRIGHTLRKPADNLTRQALGWNPQGRRRVGRPRQTWRRLVHREAETVDMTWSQLDRDAHNRVRCGDVLRPMLHWRRIGTRRRGQFYFTTNSDSDEDQELVLVFM
ncbi:hypothetical protein C0Q70_04418 [Pomacea canaliculata]|uniref:Uncharacterized protein n=1 Tax=Pomacea canaliculata TaxID=400727 RepID=A0A2T7PIC7_POMCA|nr:hypothetical protein C0Q70_04418 [Pomacea canaliculata]